MPDGAGPHTASAVTFLHFFLHQEARIMSDPQPPRNHDPDLHHIQQPGTLPDIRERDLPRERGVIASMLTSLGGVILILGFCVFLPFCLLLPAVSKVQS